MKEDADNIQKEVEEKADERERRRKPKMKVSGKSVFELKRIMEEPKEEDKD